MSTKPYNVVAALTFMIDLYWDDPVSFAQDILEFEPDDWQREAMMDVAQAPLTSIRSGQGCGKTAFESALVIWFLCCRPNPKVICTAPTRQQLHDVLWAEISKWLEQSKVKNILKWTKTKVYMIGHEERWFATARTAVKPENMQGFHEDYMLFIVDEASGIDDKIMEAILGTLSGDDNKMVMCGNPTRISGVFYDSHNKDRANYRTRRVSARDSVRTNKRNIEMLENKYGKDSDVIRVRVDGEFPRGESDAFITLEAAEFAKNEVKLQPSGNKLFVGCDVARFGSDETSIYGRIGGKVVKQKHHHKQDTMVTAGWVLRLIDEAKSEYPNIEEVEIRIDDDGVGGGVTDRLNEVNNERNLGYIIIPVHNGAKSEDEHYGNHGSELWGQIKELLEENMRNYILGLPGVLELPDDEKLISQLSTRKWRMGSNGKIFLERKEDAKKRGLSSPDRADALVLAFADIKPEFGFAFG